MISGKHKALVLKMRRRQRNAERTRQAGNALDIGGIPVDPAQLAHYNSHGAPAFVARGYYRDQPFRCADCGSEQCWRAEQQQWWYETIKGPVYAVANRCRACRIARRRRQQRKKQ